MKSKDKKIENLAEVRYLCKGSETFKLKNNNIEHHNNIKYHNNMYKYMNLKFINILMIISIYLFK